MARPIEKELYKELMRTEFSFVDRGQRSTQEIYNAVKRHFPELCDDTYLCSESCISKVKQPEWQHRVRSALQYLKTKGIIRNTGTRGLLEF